MGSTGMTGSVPDCRISKEEGRGGWDWQCYWLSLKDENHAGGESEREIETELWRRSLPKTDVGRLREQGNSG